MLVVRLQKILDLVRRRRIPLVPHRRGRPGQHANHDAGDDDRQADKSQPAGRQSIEPCDRGFQTLSLHPLRRNAPTLDPLAKDTVLVFSARGHWKMHDRRRGAAAVT